MARSQERKPKKKFNEHKFVGMKEGFKDDMSGWNKVEW